MLELLLSLFFVIFIGICSGQISKLIDFSFNEGNVLDWYYLFIYKYIKPYNEKLFKMLGGCIRCSNVWLTLFMIILFDMLVINISYPLILIAIASSDFMVTITQKDKIRHKIVKLKPNNKSRNK